MRFAFVMSFVVIGCSGSTDAPLPTPESTPAAENPPAPTDAPPPPGATTPPGMPPAPPPMPVPYTNPVLPQSCPDPGVLASGGMFYMACTGGKFEIRSSKDLVTWTDTGASILPTGKAPWALDGSRNWAPEIHEVSPGAFVAYFTAVDAQGRLAIGAAHATSPTGPFTDRGSPLVQNALGAIDATFFADDDGKKYLYWKLDGNAKGQPTPIFAEELAADGVSFMTGATAHQVLVNDASSWEGGVVEAPWVVKRSGTYYLFYAGNVYDQRYRTGVAKASSPTATFTKKGTPILGNNMDWVGPGHGSVVMTGSDWWFVHHAWPTDGAGNRDATKGREVLLDAIMWGADGWPSFATSSSAVGKQLGPAL